MALAKSAKKAPKKKAPAKKKPAAKADRVGEVAMSVAEAVAKSKKAEAEKKPSALDCAARVLVETKQPMTTKELVEAMAAKGY